MQKISQKFQKISGFQNFAKLRFCITMTKKKLILKMQGSNFTRKPNFSGRKNHILASRPKEHFVIGKKVIFSKRIFWVNIFRGPVGKTKK